MEQPISIDVVLTVIAFCLVALMMTLKPAGPSRPASAVFGLCLLAIDAIGLILFARWLGWH